MNFKVSQLKSLTAGEVAVDDLIYVIDSNPTDGSIKSKKVTVGDLIDSRIYGISSSQFVLITGYYADPSWITSLDWSKITNAPSFVTSLSALTDVQLSTPLSGQALVYNGTKWVNQGIGELDTLATVTTRGNTTTNPITVGALTVATNLISTDIGNSRVGIGTTSPAYKLEVIGTPRFSGGSAQGAIFGAGTVINLGSDAYMLATSTAGKNAGYTISRFSTGEYASFDLLTAASLGSGWSIQMRPTSTRLDIVDRSPSDNIRMTFFNGGNIAIGTTTDSGYKLRVNGTVSAQLTNATHASQVYYNTSTGELTYGAAPVPTTPTLDQVTTAGNTTTNAITVGLINSTALRAVVTITDTTAGVNNPSYFGSYDNFLQLSVNRNPSTGVYAQTGKASSQISLEGDAGTSSIRFYTTTTNNSIPSERMRIFGGGNITIGNNVDAGYKLDVAGTSAIRGTIDVIGGTLRIASTGPSTQPSYITSHSDGGWNFTTYTHERGAGVHNFTSSNGNASIFSASAREGVNINVRDLSNGNPFSISGTVTTSSAIARGQLINTTLVAAANNDVLVGLDINPTFTNGAFTGVSNYGIRLQNSRLALFDAPIYSQAGASGSNTSFSITGTAGSSYTVDSSRNLIFNTGQSMYFNTDTDGGGATERNWYFAGARTGTTGGRTYAAITVDGSGFPSLTIYNNDNGGRIQLNSNAVSYFNGGNLLVGTTTDAGYKLDVAGTGRFTGNLTVSTGGVGTNTFNANVNYLFANQNNVYGLVDLQNAAGQNVFLKVTGNPTANSNLFDYFWISGTTVSSTAGTARNIFNVSPTYNLTGAFTGTMRGFYYNPTLTSMTGAVHRAIETTSGDVVFNGGNVGIGTTNPTYKLEVAGSLGVVTPGNASAITLVGNNNHSSIFKIQNTDSTNTTFGFNFATYSDGGANRYLELGGFNTTGNIFVGSWGFNSTAAFSAGLQSNYWQDFNIYHVNSNAGQAIKFWSLGPTGSGGVIVSFVNNGNVLIGTTTDNGYKLQVNGGGAFVKGSGTTSSTTSLLLQNSNGNDIFRVNDSGTITVSRSGSGVYKDVLVNTDGTAIIGSMSNDYIYFGGGFSQTYLISSGYLNILGAYLRGNSTQGNNKIAFNYVVDLNAYGNTSLPLVFNKYAGTVTFQAAGSANIHQTEVNLNFDGGGGGPRTLRAYYYNPTFVQGPQSYDRHYAWQNTLGAMIVNSSTPQASAILQADSTTQGFLAPRMTTAQILLITSPAEGLQVYNTDLHTICFFDGTIWQRVTSTAM
jgi:hypothetical protein